ncbi:NACHT domain-containing protein [Streptacidiphilus sp. P02-A3a]|nr:NACHT domain-containing protein [Streptacidiphilus sp. P02-A3a]
MAGLEQRAGIGHTTASRALNGPTLPSEATLVALGRALGADPGPLLELRRQILPPARESSGVPVPARAGTGADSAFEDRYRRYVQERHGHLSVVGLDLSRPERAFWPLDAAYLSLELAGEPTRLALGPVGMSGPGQPDVRVERAEKALAGLDRVLVRGLAGSGKSTLLQWLAVSAVGPGLPPDLDHLNDSLPFVLPLRTLVRRDRLPSPPEFLASVGCPLAEAQPVGWADRVLSEGRGLLLVDGLDEVPSAQRGHAQTWLRELLAAYPQARVLATTRPSAVPEGWLGSTGFTELTVRPMSPRDVAVFITRWHAAAAAESGTAQERSHLAGLEEALQDTVRSQRDLARLTTTPLLCALVCALHRDRRGHLPQGRMELYEAALSMLLVRRDRERAIDVPEGIELTEHQSIQLLQRLAYWLIRNGQAEMDHDTAVALLEDALPGMPHVSAQGDARAVLTHLVGRSGLLRAPTTESVDFVHRTFQDYLGAKAAVEGHDLGLLVRHAHDDQWEDVLRMAVGHARPDERAVLLRRLVARGDRTARHRTRLHLLATACLENATELDPAVLKEVRDRTSALLPPRSDAEAETLAAVGPVILDLLPGPGGLEEDEAASVVHTAGLIGGDQAMATMKRFRGCTQWEVKWELQQAWRRFDTDAYLREVLQHVPDLHAVGIHTAEQLAAVARLVTPPTVFVYGGVPGHALATPLDPEQLRSLTFFDDPAVRELDFVRAFPSLAHLAFYDCPNIEGLAPLSGSAVSRLTLSGCSPTLIHELAELRGLRQLVLDMELPVSNLADLPVDADLDRLDLGLRASEGISLRGISRWPRLTYLGISSLVGGLPEMAALAELKELYLGRAHRAVLAELPPVPQVERLQLALHPSERDHGFALELVASKLPRLRSLSLNCSDVHGIDLAPLGGLTDLAVLDLYQSAEQPKGAEYLPEVTINRTPRPRS